MISWNLWRAFCTPFVSHPIYQLSGVWDVKKLDATSRAWWLIHLPRTIQLLLVVIVGAVIVASFVVGPSILLLVFFGIPFFVMIVILPIALIIIGTLYGLVFATITAEAIAIEQQRGRYALLKLTPKGQTSATWALCNLEFHRHEWLHQIREGIASIYTMLLTLMFFPFGFTLMLLVVTPNEPEAQHSFLTVILWITIVLIPGLDFVQSTNTGGLVGMIVPLASQTNARGLAMITFLALQFVTYMLVAFFCLFVWVRLFYRLEIAFDFRYGLLCLITIYTLRETITIGLLLILVHYMDAELIELDQITRIGIRRWLRG